MDCETTVVSQSELGCVTVCGCGAVTIHCGNASMRIHKEAFTIFARMMDEAFANLATLELGSGHDCCEEKDKMSKLYPGMGPLCG